MIPRRLRWDSLADQERPLVAEDYAFSPSDYPSARELDITHEEIFLEETPLALRREIHLVKTSRPHTSVSLRLALCWNGFRDALTLLTRFTLSFERAVPTDALVNTAETYKIGDLGVAWPWSGQGDPDVLSFVRNNVVVCLDGHDAAALVVPLAREIDEALRRLRTANRYGEDPRGLFAGVRERLGEAPRVSPGGRLELGEFVAEGGARLFFLTTRGSVNRCPDRPDTWYYRAGTQKGPQDVTLLRVGRGILPVKEHLTVEVV